MMTTRKRTTPPMGLEPTTFELEVQRATIAPRGSTTHLFEPQRVTHSKFYSQTTNCHPIDNYELVGILGEALSTVLHTAPLGTELHTVSRMY